MIGMTSAQHFDLVIIGTGSGNSIPSPEFDGKSIAIIEKGTFGGTCLNVGCIPTKMYVYAADVALAAREATRLGLSAHVDAVDWEGIVKRVFHNRIDQIAQGGEEYRRGEETPNITVFDQHARFIGPKTLQAGEDIITGDNIVIATGSRPVLPEPYASATAPVHTNEDIMRLEKQPRSLIVVGGGYIAMEFAHVFDGLGTDVTVVNRSEKFLRFLDEDLSSRFNDLARKRFDVRIGTATALDETEDGVRLTLDSGDVVEADAILVATGRQPNGDQMDLSASGIEMHEDGRIKVDEFGRTTCEGVWALGDVSSPYMLKHVANAEQRAVQHNLLHPDDLQPMPHEHVPAAVFTHPQIATVGLTETQAREEGYDVTVKVQNFGDVAYGWAMEDSTGICKLVADRATGKLLGAHIMGPQASTLIQQLITAMSYDLDMRNFARSQYWIHPALPEVVENAVLGLEWLE
ncbi:mycothione reductase [Corynebacterium guaraldiae]|uniref:mycothione reductase n=1 Tax=Corynebacterium guaraldiae TaxID=3051103 RepID=UPI00117770BF|nr:mycothione reductase [Corynebacterium guaraldiae]TRX33950.1 mycothione reductase [Corynebacterium guaraldiae]TRX37130.1 mycothione reductase [Corynebacterium guaraldiae]